MFHLSSHYFIYSRKNLLGRISNPSLIFSQDRNSASFTTWGLITASLSEILPFFSPQKWTLPRFCCLYILFTLLHSLKQNALFSAFSGTTFVKVIVRLWMDIAKKKKKNEKRELYSQLVHILEMGWLIFLWCSWVYSLIAWCFHLVEIGYALI